MNALPVKLTLVVTVAVLLGTAAVLLLTLGGSAEGDRPLIDTVQDALDEDAAKGRFTGPLGDFVIHSRMGDAPESTRVACEKPSVQEHASGAEDLSRFALWSDVFGPAAYGTLCDGELIALNNGSEPVDGADSTVITYVEATPVLALFDAPRERIELIEIDGHSAVIEHPLEGYPHATANLTLIARYPSPDQPGIAVYVNFADSSEAAIALAKEMIPADQAVVR